MYNKIGWYIVIRTGNHDHNVSSCEKEILLMVFRSLWGGRSNKTLSKCCFFCNAGGFESVLLCGLKNTID